MPTLRGTPLRLGPNKISIIFKIHPRKRDLPALRATCEEVERCYLGCMTLWDPRLGLGQRVYAALSSSTSW